MVKLGIDLIKNFILSFSILFLSVDVNTSIFIFSLSLIISSSLYMCGITPSFSPAI